jgi:hypothetical protein
MNPAPAVDRTKPRGLRFAVRSGLVTIAGIALVLAGLDAWIRAPYRAEGRAAAALTRLGGKIVIVDGASPWLRQYVSSRALEMPVAAVDDLSGSQVTDDDLVHVQAFHHFGQLNLADTQITDAGVANIRGAIAYRFIDLSRTRVTQPSALFGEQGLEHPSGLKLSGIRLGGRPIFPFKSAWCPLQELDLSFTDIDDQTLAGLPEGLVNLSKLDLAGTAITDAGLRYLARLHGLTTLNLVGTRVTAEGAARLMSVWKGRGKLTVVTGPLAKGTGTGWPYVVPPAARSGWKTTRMPGT